MENKEFTYQGKTLNGILMLVLNIIGFCWLELACLYLPAFRKRTG